MQIMMDTSPKMRRLWEQLQGRRTPAESLQRAQQLTLFVQHLPHAAHRQRAHPPSDEEIWRAIARHRVGDTFRPTAPADPFALAPRVARILESQSIAYVIGGAVAAIAWGEPRSTLGLDIMVDGDARNVAAAMPDDFVFAERGRGVHRETATEIQFFTGDSPAAFERRRSINWGGAPLSFCAPEDVIVRKLAWRGGVFETQWRDVVEILRIAREPLDNAYLDRAAVSFEVTDLLARAREAAK